MLAGAVTEGGVLSCKVIVASQVLTLLPFDTCNLTLCGVSPVYGPAGESVGGEVPPVLPASTWLAVTLAEQVASAVTVTSWQRACGSARWSPK